MKALNIYFNPVTTNPFLITISHIRKYFSPKDKGNPFSMSVLLLLVLIRGVTHNIRRSQGWKVWKVIQYLPPSPTTQDSASVNMTISQLTDVSVYSFFKH